MQIVVFEDAAFRQLLPLVYSRATFNLRCGFDNLLAKIETAMGVGADVLFVRPALAAVIAERQTRPVNRLPAADDQLWINGRLLLRRAIELPPQSAAWAGGALGAARVNAKTAALLATQILENSAQLRGILASHRSVEVPAESALMIDYPWQLVNECPAEIERQSRGREFNLAGNIYAGASLIDESPIHVGPGSKVKPGVVLDAEGGPIWIGENVVVQPNAVVAGPCYIGDGCVIQSGASIRGGSSIGMVCKVGGEIEGTIFHGYSNKQHDGFLGHSYVGEWVNLGADTVNSDLKNTYGRVSVPINGRLVDSGLAFVGAIIGDHAKTAIGTQLPTGGVIGYSCNIAVSGFAPKFVPSFTWLTDEGEQRYDPERALETAHKVVSRRNRVYSAAEDGLFQSIVEESGRQEAAGAP